MSLTIFTPTFNRGTKLIRLYSSLKEQSKKNFEWLIIDDGSTDNTKEIVEQYIKENIIKIIYIKKENGGKQSCWNHAVKYSRAKYFLGIDSDDSILKDGLERVEKLLKKIENEENIIGIRLNSISMSTGKVTGLKELKSGVYSWREETFKFKNYSEKVDIYKTKILKNFLYPLEENIKFIPEIWFYSKISSKGFKFLYENQSLRIFYDPNFENDGDRLNFASLLKNSKGHIIARKEVLNNDFDLFIYNPIYHIKNTIRLIECCMYQKDNVFELVDKKLRKLFVFLLYPIGFLFYKKNKVEKSSL